MIDVVMPQMGESIVEGTLTKWLKKPGEKIERDEPLFEISTDKVDTEIPAPGSGTLAEVLVEEGKTVAINSVVARIQEANGAGGASAPAEAAPPASEASPQADGDAMSTKPEDQPISKDEVGPPPSGQPAPQKAQDEGAAQQSSAPSASETTEPAGPLSPIVRKLARENNLDLKLIKGTGAGGRITKSDVENYLTQGGKSAGAQQPVPAGAGAYPSVPETADPQKPAYQPAPAAAAAPAQASAPAQAPVGRGEQPKSRVEPMSNMRQKIAEHMIMSQNVSAHVTTVHKVDMTKVAKLRDREKGEFQARHGFSLTFLPFVARATAEALRAFPIVNASIEGTNIVYHNEINLGIAVALEGGSGLIVPVIRNADEKNVVGLQRSIVDLAARARSRALKADEVAGGTFSITNFGSFGSVFATPVINQPQVAILGVGAVEKVPVVVEDAIAIRSVAYIALSFDHRLIDGALADQFCTKVKEVLQNWTGSIL